MDVVDDILQYIPDISDNDFLDNSEFILLSPFGIQTSANDEENMNYVENKKINEEYKGLKCLRTISLYKPKIEGGSGESDTEKPDELNGTVLNNSPKESDNLTDSDSIVI